MNQEDYFNLDRARRIAIESLNEIEPTATEDLVAPWVLRAVDRALGENNFNSADGGLPHVAGPDLLHFSLVLAEVNYTCELGFQTRRVQFINKSNSELFPHSRLLQLQQLAASNAGAEIRSGSKGAIQKIQIEGVYLLAITPCGWMSDEQFAGVHSELVSVDETPVGETGTPENADNVVPFPGG